MAFETIELTNAERERLVMLMEECGELIQATSKVLRHGWESYHPAETDMTKDNLAAFLKEALDVQAVLYGVQINSGAKRLRLLQEPYQIVLRWREKQPYTHFQHLT